MVGIKIVWLWYIIVSTNKRLLKNMESKSGFELIKCSEHFYIYNHLLYICVAYTHEIQQVWN